MTGVTRILEPCYKLDQVKMIALCLFTCIYFKSRANTGHRVSQNTSVSGIFHLQWEGVAAWGDAHTNVQISFLNPYIIHHVKIWTVDTKMCLGDLKAFLCLIMNASLYLILNARSDLCL